METPQLSGDAYEVAEAIADTAQSAGLTVATAESLTAGQVAAHLGAASGSSAWFRGSVVSYADEVKFKVLDVARGPVISADCASAMADGARRLLDADVAVAVTGVGGPDEQEGQPAGRVFIAVNGNDAGRCEQFDFEGDPKEILTATALEALKLLGAHLREVAER
jgi:nicotinamide-nucleotide amidase